MMSVKLSIIVPTYLRNDSLPRLLDAFSRQTHTNFEVIVVDQNPDDTVPQWVADFSAVLPLRRIHLTEPNASTARNHGFKASNGDVVLFVDDDLIPEPDFCARGMEVLQTYGDTVKCLCPVIVVNGEDTGREHVIPTTQLNNSALHRLKNSITAAVFFDRDFFVLTGGFDELLFQYARTAEDQELFLRMKTRDMTYWLDKSLRIDHDETAPGGCELRTDKYWNTRERCIKSWVLRHRIHGGQRGRLNVRDLYMLSRSAFLNRGVLGSGIGTILKNINLLRTAITDSRRKLAPHLDRYQSIDAINHLAD
jgi:cellulose synthase/poly-beta-1,6-N-acetylglucosamine synthase-like glycosyltransferase